MSNPKHVSYTAARKRIEAGEAIYVNPELKCGQFSNGDCFSPQVILDLEEAGNSFDVSDTFYGVPEAGHN